MFRTTFALLIICSLHGWALGGTVITTNLPSNTAIVNISGTQDGAAAFSGTNSELGYHPFFTGGASGLLQYTIQPGTYGFRLTNPSLVAAEFPELTGAQLAQLFTAWTYNSPWATDYMVFDSAAATNFSLPQLFSVAIMPTSHYPGFLSAASAFNTAVAEGYSNKIVVAPGGRYTGTTATQYTFAAPQTLIFAVFDYDLSDNNGGISVVISPVTPAHPPGDYNDDGTVDAADYVLWRKNNNTAVTLPNDSTPGSGTSPADYTFWRAHFGQTAGSGSGSALPSAESLSSTVPEPSVLVLLMLAAAGWCLRRGRAP